LKRHCIKLEDIVINPTATNNESNSLEKSLFADEPMIASESAIQQERTQESAFESTFESTFDSTTAVINETPQMMEE
jgi:hypothetical protein